ncbi:MAG: hypothetical protein JST93_22060 [Acidobacteria bacterium]|nr:hypothetical protein [Acidobacteriota bacterium]
MIKNQSVYISGPNAYNTAVDRTYPVVVNSGVITIEFFQRFPARLSMRLKSYRPWRSPTSLRMPPTTAWFIS